MISSVLTLCPTSYPGRGILGHAHMLQFDLTIYFLVYPYFYKNFQEPMAGTSTPGPGEDVLLSVSEENVIVE